jgi:uncharacterized protein YcbK (DUF882 family)
VKLSPKLLNLLEELRTEWSAPLIITSAFRCAPHNRAVGGTSRSLHLDGLAADVFARPAVQLSLRRIAERLGFSEIICGGRRNYIHLAIDRDVAA